MEGLHVVAIENVKRLPFSLTESRAMGFMCRSKQSASFTSHSCQLHFGFPVAAVAPGPSGPAWKCREISISEEMRYFMLIGVAGALSNPLHLATWFNLLRFKGECLPHLFGRRCGLTYSCALVNRLLCKTIVFGGPWWCCAGVNNQKILRAPEVSGHIDSRELKSLYFLFLFLFLFVPDLCVSEIICDYWGLSAALTRFFSKALKCRRVIRISHMYFKYLYLKYCPYLNIS